MAANVSIVSVDDEEMDSDKQYDLQRTIMFGQYSRLADFARSYGEGLRKRTESDVSGSSSAVRMPRSRLNRGKRTMWKYIMRVVNVSKHVVLPNIAEWLYLIVLAVLMAILSYLLDLLIEQFGAAHQKFYKLVTNGFASYLLWVLFSIVFVLFSVGICQIISVNALGSGIPEMKTILRGIELQNYLQFRTLIAKIAGLATVVGSGLPVGKEGPFVHMSSILAHQMGKLITRFNKSIYNEGHNYELLAAACALGVSSNFAAPIGGVLFSIEVTSTYFAVRNYWRGFFAAVIGAFLFRLFAYWFTAEATITALFKTSFAIEIPFNVYEIPVFAMIGVLCGLLAALFVYFHRKCVMWLRKYRKKIKILDKSVFIYPTLVTIIITTVTFPKSTGQYLAGEVTQRESIDHFFSNLTWRTIKDIELLNEDSVEFSIASAWGSPSFMIFVTLILFLITRFVFTALANTLPVPAGVFFPVFIIGAALGRLVGEVMHVIAQGEIQGQSIVVGGYAVVGAAAMAGGVTHTISTSVIVFELTGQITHILPVMIAVLISNAIANLLQPSFYDSIILIKNLPFLPDLKLSKAYNLFAKDFMRKKDLFYISSQTTYGDLQELLREELHSSYPLIDHPDTRVLLGSVKRDVLKKMLRNHLQPVRDHKRRILANVTGDEQDVLESVDLSMDRRSPTRGPVFYRQVRHSIVNTLLSEGREQNDAGDIELPIDTSGRVSFPTELVNLESELLSKTILLESSQIDPSPFQLVEKTSLYKAHSLFSLLGLSHSFVTSNGKLVGVVTMDDLVTAIRLGNEIKNDPYYMEPTTQEMNPLVAVRDIRRDEEDDESDSHDSD